MKKHELLEKAMRDYPKGKKIIPPFLKHEYVSTGIFRLDSQNDIEMMDEGVPILLIYTHSEVNEGTWAEIIPEKPERKFIMKSEDGVDLYEGDEPCWVLKPSEGKYEIQDRLSKCILCKENKCMVSHYIIFSTKEVAEKWIEEQNKPKHATVELYRHKEYKSAEVTNDKITIRDGNDIYYLKASDIEDMYHALKSL